MVLDMAISQDMEFSAVMTGDGMPVPNPVVMVISLVMVRGGRNVLQVDVEGVIAYNISKVFIFSYIFLIDNENRKIYNYNYYSVGPDP